MNIIKQTIGTISIKKHHENVMPSIMQKMKNIIRVSPKFMREEIEREKTTENEGERFFL